jgi:hypothetical protein
MALLSKASAPVLTDRCALPPRLIQAEAANMLIESAAELLKEAERLEAEGEAGGDKQDQTAEGASGEGKDAANGSAEANGNASAGLAAGVAGGMDPGSGLEHIEAEAAAAGEGGEEGEEALTPAQTAQHFALRNLCNAGEAQWDGFVVVALSSCNAMFGM